MKFLTHPRKFSNRGKHGQRVQYKRNYQCPPEIETAPGRTERNDHAHEKDNRVAGCSLPCLGDARYFRYSNCGRNATEDNNPLPESPSLVSGYSHLVGHTRLIRLFRRFELMAD